MRRGKKEGKVKMKRKGGWEMKRIERSGNGRKGREERDEEV